MLLMLVLQKIITNTVQQLTNVTNVTLACDDDKRRRSQSCYKGWGHGVGKHCSSADLFTIKRLLIAN